jgi:hypothetical protein
VLPDRIELSTSPLPMECSTTELRQHALDPRIDQKGPQGGRSLPQGQGARKHGKGPVEAEIAVICAPSGPIPVEFWIAARLITNVKSAPLAGFFRFCALDGRISAKQTGRMVARQAAGHDEG